MLKTIKSHSPNIIIYWILINSVVCVSSLQLIHNDTENASSFASYTKVLRTIYSYLVNGSHMEPLHSNNGNVTTTTTTITPITTSTTTTTTTTLATTTETIASNLILVEQRDDQTSLLNESDSGLRKRYKHNIPALEPVKHLLNGVRSGNLTNHTTLFNWNHLHPTNMEMPNEMLDDSMAENQTSAAIETKEEREMTNVSPNLKVLEFLGTIGSKVWAFLTHVRQGFFNFIGNASAASSA